MIIAWEPIFKTFDGGKFFSAEEAREHETAIRDADLNERARQLNDRIWPSHPWEMSPPQVLSFLLLIPEGFLKGALMGLGVPRESLLDRVSLCIDELTGLIDLLEFEGISPGTRDNVPKIYVKRKLLEGLYTTEDIRIDVDALEEIVLREMEEAIASLRRADHSEE